MAPKYTDREIREHLGKWMDYFMKKWGLQTKAEMARRLDVAPSTVSNIVNRKRTAGLDVAYKMSQAFNRSLEQLVAEDPPSD